jgi:hypothetical protein
MAPACAFCPCAKMPNSTMAPLPSRTAPSSLSDATQGASALTGCLHRRTDRQDPSRLPEQLCGHNFEPHTHVLRTREREARHQAYGCTLWLQGLRTKACTLQIIQQCSMQQCERGKWHA